MDWLDIEFKIFPLWLCPVTRSDQIIMKPCAREIYISIGVSGHRLPNRAGFATEYRKLKRKVREVGGLKWLYAHCRYTEADFQKIHDDEWYDALRARYHTTYLPSVYDEIKLIGTVKGESLRDPGYAGCSASFGGYGLYWGSMTWLCVLMQGGHLLGILRERILAANLSERRRDSS